ncbi:MAG: crotonase/enoyl-CoA hydratase family protein [Alphaproteobacteria bacterium]|jgi:2-(1,2-epoxy-1,2-dihydrophenyl)acetyl-CoA isomerase|uniref:2,3-dehydroadipyl-CoA hydratase n=1 Tax=Brevundimonas mediterranea TaxID=74329 RepID=A0A6G7EF07_9CAUL|nr:MULTISPECIES: crotonase/enoyl-CoA hydratase family protein [Brevundimonas]MBU4198168.1 crotonase/enoyl-CoA hydratase family protein [Alphaproteobacteria bacterium]OGN48814.1 MAG: enoyl-CoA hydratase [Caulobacterales bacterium RIFCSPHIGHO2_12_FULL_68_13]OYX81228.1 MAG: enoyl-CoA hydratase [Brevundimonas sp. 32-68-21]EDX81710.1 enoyl-CoA hydratase/isomerase family protein [Brevundimonas sp. BAL3]MBA4331841.1 enoyl-CoA hydratase [Brevundimonas sp.]
MGLIAETRQGAILIWTLDRETRLNALPDLTDGDEFADACARANADMTVKCVVLTGAGRAFSAGGDLTAMRDRRDLFEGSGAEIRARYRRVVHRIVRSLYDLEIPLVSAVNGPAMGLGCGIAATADIRIASDRASFGVPFLKLGIIPGDGGAWRLPRDVGYARAAEMLFTGRSIDAETAERWGLVNRVVPHDRLMDEALITAGQIAAQPPQALRMAKTLMRQGRDQTFEQILELSAAMQALAHMTEDHLEGVNAVLEKRPGDFTGR